MLSQTAEHALRAVLFLAQQPPDELVPAAAIAAALGAPGNYMAKTLNVLAQHGIVTSMRGPTGGFRLVVAPPELSLARVIDVFDEPRHRRMCLLGGRPCSDRTPCDAHLRWLALSEGARAPLREMTVADLLPGPGGGPSHAALPGLPAEVLAVATRAASRTRDDRLDAARAEAAAPEDVPAAPAA